MSGIKRGLTAASATTFRALASTACALAAASFAAWISGSASFSAKGCKTDVWGHMPVQPQLQCKAPRQDATRLDSFQNKFGT